jgi:hypothetical protein
MEKKIKKSSHPARLLSTWVKSFKVTAAIAMPVKTQPTALISEARVSLKSTFVLKAMAKEDPEPQSQGSFR